MKKSLKFLIVMEVIVLAVLAGWGIGWLVENLTARAAYKDLSDMADIVKIQAEETGEDEDPLFLELTRPDMSALKKQYPDLICWIQIPDTVVDYPVMQGDDSFYLNHLYTGEKSSNGSIFMHSGITDGLQNKNPLIFGHNMRSGSMFATLNKYHTREYLDEHPFFYLTDLDGTIYEYEIFSVYRASENSGLFQFGFGENVEFERYIDRVTALSEYDLGISVWKEDSIATLSTCIGGHATRTIVHGVLRRTIEP